MKRLALFAAAVFALIATPAAAQRHVGVAVSIGTPHVTGYFSLGAPHVHRAGTVIVLGAPRPHVYGPSLRVVGHPGHHRHKAHDRHHRHHDRHDHAHRVGTCGGGHGCR